MRIILSKTLSFFLFISLIVACQGSKLGEVAKMNVSESSITIPAAGGSFSFSISSNAYWDIIVADPEGKPVGWLTISTTSGSGDKQIELTASANLVTKPRVAILSVSSPSSKELTHEIIVSQEAGEEALHEGYSFPICQTIDIDSPESRKLVNAAIVGYQCMFVDGMVLSRSNQELFLELECPSHTQPSSGTDEDKSIHRSIRFPDFAQGESIIISVPVKEALYGNLRLMLGARAASFTQSGWSYYWGADGETWNQIDITNATTPGSDAVWNNIPFTISQGSAIQAGGKLYIKLTADGARSRNYVVISNSICVFPAEAERSNLPAMDASTIAYSNGFDDLIGSTASYVEYPVGWLACATNSYASGYNKFNDHYIVDASHSTIASASGCYEKPGYLQVGYYDESLWTRQCIGTFTILIGERLKAMGVSSADAEFTLKTGIFKDFRGYDPLAKVTVTCGETSSVLDLPVGTITNAKVILKNLTQESVIAITTPKLTEEELSALGRGVNASNLQDYRFYIDDLLVTLTEIHSRGSSSNGQNEDFNNVGSYNW